MEFTESMFVVGVVFNNSFIIRNLYELLPIVLYNGYTFTKGGKTLPFFGINNSIVSIIPKISTKGDEILKVRGIRQSLNDNEISSQGFGNSVAIDFQTLGKNYHIKLYSSKKIESKFHITGLTNFESSKTVTLNLLDQIKLTEECWTPFFHLNYYERFNFMKIIYDVVVKDNQLLKPDHEDVKKFLDNLDSSYSKYKSTINLILRYTYEDKTPIDFANRIHKICYLSSGPCSIFHNEQVFHINMYDIYIGNYIGTIGYTQLFLKHITEKLSQLNYRACYSNIGKPEIRIMIPIVNEEHFNNGPKKKTIDGHLFIIKLGGTISLSSKANVSECLSIGKMIIELIRSIVESQEYSDALYGKINQNNINEQLINNQYQNNLINYNQLQNQNLDYNSVMDSILAEL
jgi:hypothetical protein